MLLAVVRKSLKEQRRDIMVLALSILTAPLFVFIYWAFFGEGDNTYQVLVASEQHHRRVQKEVLTKLESNSALRIRLAETSAGRHQLMDHSADVMLVLPETLSGTNPRVTLVGDLSNPKYAVAAILVVSQLEEYAMKINGTKRPLIVNEEALGNSSAKSALDIYVPGLLVLAVVMLVFQSSMSLARELESGTIFRLKMTPMNVAAFLGGISIVQVVTGVASVLVTLVVAKILGFQSEGPLWTALVVGALTAIPVVGTGLIVASLSKTVSQAFVMANFPLMFFMFFTGAIFPIPKMAVFDLLPPTHAVNALNKILTMGVDIWGVKRELISLTVLSIAYFTLGVVLFRKNIYDR